MKNLIAATQSAVFQILLPLQQDANLTAALGTAVQVRTHVKQDTQPPILKVGVTASSSEAERYDQVERITVEIQGIWRGEGTTPLFAMLHAARVLLDGQHLESEDAQIQPPEYISTETSDAFDGNLYIGILTFEMLVEPA